MALRTGLALPVVVGVVATVIVAFAYLFGLANLRQNANHPQLEMVHSAVSRLNSGESPQSVVPSRMVDIASSADSFLIVVDGQDTVLASSANVAGSTIIPPAGVFGYVRDHGEDVISWQPAPGVRSAIVVDAFHGGFVVGGRSLNETERQESIMQAVLIAVWVVAVLGALGLALARARRTPR